MKLKIDKETARTNYPLYEWACRHSIDGIAKFGLGDDGGFEIRLDVIDDVDGYFKKIPLEEIEFALDLLEDGEEALISFSDDPTLIKKFAFAFYLTEIPYVETNRAYRDEDRDDVEYFRAWTGKDNDALNLDKFRSGMWINDRLNADETTWRGVLWRDQAPTFAAVKTSEKS